MVQISAPRTKPMRPLLPHRRDETSDEGTGHDADAHHRRVLIRQAMRAGVDVGAQRADHRDRHDGRYARAHLCAHEKSAPKMPAHHTMALRVNGVWVASTR